MDFPRSPSVAVGIPTKDNADTIRETLESLTAQTRRPDRIIVVDASTDDTPDIIREIADSSDIEFEYVRESSDGRGVSVARQQIYDRLEEDILACLDTELRVSPDWLEKHVEFHAENPEYGVLSASSYGEGPVTNPRDRDYFVQGNCSIKKRALDRVDGWDIWMGRGEDWDIRIRFAATETNCYRRTDIQAQRVSDRNLAQWVTKIRNRPSSVAFLRKYGLWYLTFHPAHVLGDAVSAASLVSLCLGVVLLPFFGLSVPFFLLPLLGVAGYLYVDVIVPNGVEAVRPMHALYVPRFLLLGYTALRELREGTDYEWNYAGVESQEALDNVPT